MRKLILIIVLALAVFLTVKFDLLTTAKLGLENRFYKQDIQKIGRFHILVEVTNAEIERAGLTRESIRETVVQMLEKSGVGIIPEELWQKTPGDLSEHLGQCPARRRTERHLPVHDPHLRDQKEDDRSSLVHKKIK